MSTVSVADATSSEWWTNIGDEANLVLTDPPHLDRFDSAPAHYIFTSSWYPHALRVVHLGGTLLHSCGVEPEELANYLRVRVPRQVLVWTYPELESHRYWLLHTQLDVTLPTVWNCSKPDPLYRLLLLRLASSGCLVADPFCGRGEIPSAARELGLGWVGCDLDEESVRACWEQGL